MVEYYMLSDKKKNTKQPDKTLTALEKKVKEEDKHFFIVSKEINAHLTDLCDNSMVRIKKNTPIYIKNVRYNQNTDTEYKHKITFAFIDYDKEVNDKGQLVYEDIYLTDDEIERLNKSLKQNTLTYALHQKEKHLYEQNMEKEQVALTNWKVNLIVWLIPTFAFAMAMWFLGSGLLPIIITFVVSGLIFSLICFISAIIGEYKNGEDIPIEEDCKWYTAYSKSESYKMEERAEKVAVKETLREANKLLRSVKELYKDKNVNDVKFYLSENYELLLQLGFKNPEKDESDYIKDVIRKAEHRLEEIDKNNKQEKSKPFIVPMPDELINYVYKANKKDKKPSKKTNNKRIDKPIDKKKNVKPSVTHQNDQNQPKTKKLDIPMGSWQTFPNSPLQLFVTDKSATQ